MVVGCSPAVEGEVHLDILGVRILVAAHSLEEDIEAGCCIAVACCMLVVDRDCLMRRSIHRLRRRGRVGCMPCLLSLLPEPSRSSLPILTILICDTDEARRTYAQMGRRAIDTVLVANKEGGREGKEIDAESRGGNGNYVAFEL